MVYFAAQSQSSILKWVTRNENQRIIKPVGNYVLRSRYIHQGKGRKHSKLTDKELLLKENVKLFGINFSSMLINDLIVTYTQ